jgi:hypothetical protein
MVGAYLRAYDGEYGIWLAGVAKPGLSATAATNRVQVRTEGRYSEYVRVSDRVSDKVKTDLLILP